MDLIWRLCSLALESGVGPENWRSAVIVPLYKGSIYIRGICLLRVAGKL